MPAGTVWTRWAVLEELRNPMIEAGEQDKFLKASSSTVGKISKEAAPLELMVDYCRHTSNSHQLPLALSQLADLCTSTGNYSRAEECLQELIDRDKDDERLVERLKICAPRAAAPRNPRPKKKPKKPLLSRRHGWTKNEKPIVPRRPPSSKRRR